MKNLNISEGSKPKILRLKSIMYHVFRMYENLNDISSPLEQFEIRDYLSIDAPIFFNVHFALSNIGTYLCIAASIVLTLNLLASNYNKVVTNN